MKEVERGDGEGEKGWQGLRVGREVRRVDRKEGDRGRGLDGNGEGGNGEGGNRKGETLWGAKGTGRRRGKRRGRFHRWI